MQDDIGKYAYIIGVIAAVIVGALSGNLPGTSLMWLTSLVIIAGLIVGFLNIGTKEVKDFLLISTVLVIVAYAGSAGTILKAVYMVGPYLEGIFTQLLAFVVPATVVVALKAILLLAKK